MGFTGGQQKMALQDIELGPLGAEEVEVAVEDCGLGRLDSSPRPSEDG
jgi:hypothetical protein